MRSYTLDHYIEKQLEDPAFKKAWQESELQYQTVRLLIGERISQKISQRKLAKRADTTQAVICRIENFSVNPSLVLLEKIAKGLGKKLEIRLV